MRDDANFSELNDYFCAKAQLKQDVYAIVLQAFQKLKAEASSVIEELKKDTADRGHALDLVYSENGAFEAEMRFSGDALALEMHTNIFAFPKDHFIHQTKSVKEEPNTGFVGMILIYNFLADSLRYNRLVDVGYLLGRIFINKDGRYFMDGSRQFSFLFNDFDNQVFDEGAARKIIFTAMKHSIDFDLFVPPFDQVKEITLHQKVMQQGSAPIKTGKRLGFEYDGRGE